MGFGDVKLAGVLGMYLGYLGWAHVFAGTFAAFLLGGLWSLALLAARRGTLKSPSLSGRLCSPARPPPCCCRPEACFFAGLST